MATASSVSVSLKADGNTVTVPVDDVARLMYYLQCVTTGIGINVLPPDLTNYRHYQHLTTARRNLVFKYAYELSPDLFIDKVIFLDNGHEVIPRGYNNEFCTISAAVSLVSIQQDLLLAGKAQSASRVMFYNTAWLQTHYWEPFRRNRFAIARAVGSLHCLHCDGTNGLCSCSNGCPRGRDTQCREFDSTAGIELLTDFFEALSTISSPPSDQDSSRVIATAHQQDSETHNAVCDGCTESKEDISGERFKCRVCDDYDLCETCYTSNVHDLSHDFFLIKSPGAQRIALAKRNPHTATCDGCTRTEIEGTRYRCRSCDDFDFCQDCYARKPHNPSHLFKAIEYPGANPIPLPTRAWLRPPNPPTPAPVRPSTLVPSASDNNNHTPRTPSVSNLSLDATELPPPYDASTPFFYHDFSIPDLKKYLQAREVTYMDVLDRESLTRRVWDTHVDCMSVPEINSFLREQSISTIDCIDINSRRQKAKDSFQVSRPAVTVPLVDSLPLVKLDDKVLLSGLKKVEMNGKTGTVVNIDLAAGRAEVYIEDLGRSFKVKFENVTLDTTSEGGELLD